MNYSNLCRIVLVLASVTFEISAQVSRSEFEVASIKLSPDPTGLFLTPKRSGEHIIWHGAPLPVLVLYAYDVTAAEVVGTTPMQVYDIDAVAAPDASTAEVRAMFQHLLVTRLAFQAHREMQSMTALSLVVGPKGSKLQPSKEDSAVKLGGRPLPGGMAGNFFERDGMHLSGRAVTMDKLAAAISQAAKRPVVDKTGLMGEFDFDVVYARDVTPQNADDPNVPIEVAIREQLGLELKSATAQVNVLVISGIGKLTDNN